MAQSRFLKLAMTSGELDQLPEKKVRKHVYFISYQEDLTINSLSQHPQASLPGTGITRRPRPPLPHAMALMPLQKFPIDFQACPAPPTSF